MRERRVEGCDLPVGKAARYNAPQERTACIATNVLTLIGVIARRRSPRSAPRAPAACVSMRRHLPTSVARAAPNLARRAVRLNASPFTNKRRARRAQSSTTRCATTRNLIIITLPPPSPRQREVGKVYRGGGEGRWRRRGMGRPRNRHKGGSILQRMWRQILWLGHTRDARDQILLSRPAIGPNVQPLQGARRGESLGRER